MPRRPTEADTRRLALISREGGARLIRTSVGYVCRGWEAPPGSGEPGQLLDGSWVFSAIRAGWLVPSGPLRGDGLADRYMTRTAKL
jgi:hypothetical protein